MPQADSWHHVAVRKSPQLSEVGRSYAWQGFIMELHHITCKIQIEKQLLRPCDPCELYSALFVHGQCTPAPTWGQGTQLLGVSLGARGVPASNTGTHDDEGRGWGGRLLIEKVYHLPNASSRALESTASLRGAGEQPRFTFCHRCFWMMCRSDRTAHPCPRLRLQGSFLFESVVLSGIKHQMLPSTHRPKAASTMYFLSRCCPMG